MIKRIGIVGAGQMGSGIAHVCAATGHHVTLCDVSQDQLNAAISNIDKNMDRMVSKQTMTAEDKDASLKRIKTSQDLGDLSDRDLVIEAATENEDTKAKILGALSQILQPSCLIATNTSSISITRLASYTDRPGKFIGMHFMNPVPVMKLVELIKGLATEENTFDRIHDLVIKLGKTPAISQDFPAFIVNRILLPMINEAIFALYEGIGDAQSIDNAMKMGANHPMGPLELADFIGLDTCLAVMKMLYEGFSDSKYRPCPLLIKYVEAGWLGRKTKRGFYDYSLGTPVPSRS